MQIEWCVALRRSGKSTRCTDLEKCDTRCSRNSSEAGPKSYNAPLDSSLVSRPPLRSYEYPRISKHFSYYPYLLLISTTHEIFPSHAYRVIIRLQQSRYLCLYRANTSNIYIQMYFPLLCTHADKTTHRNPSNSSRILFPLRLEMAQIESNRKLGKNQLLPTILVHFQRIYFLESKYDYEMKLFR